jgi:threonylcarbamoyladenosine tRNA methylthiotransferase MtaB
MKVAFYTLGCKVNTYETMSVKEQFEQRGYTIVDAKAFADVYVVNTCTVTNNADSKSRKMIRRMNRQNPDAVVAVMGCYAQMDPETISKIDGVDIIMGTTHRDQLIEHVESVLNDRLQIQAIDDVASYRAFDELHVSHYLDHTRAFIKIQDGCNNFCSYCIIPYARGRVRSRPYSDVINETKTLIKNGYKEIVLTGIHTGGYGADLDVSFYDLLKGLSQLEGLKRLRISSIEINELSDDILTLIKENTVFARHLHIPLQSGSNAVLKDMRRHYTKEDYLRRIQAIRALIPDIAITTDIIVGYPTETKERFEEMVDFVKTCAFTEMHVFPFSKRNGTKAAQYTQFIHGDVKQERVQTLLELNQHHHQAFINQIRENPLSVLFESSDDTYTYGHASNYLYVAVPKEPTLHNTIKDVLISEVKESMIVAKKIR